MTTLIDTIKASRGPLDAEDVRQLNHRIAETEALLDGLRDERDRILGEIETRHVAGGMAEALMERAPVTGVHFEPADDLAQESNDDLDTQIQRERAAMELHRMRITSIEQLKLLRREASRRRISPAALAAQVAAQDAAHAQRLAEDASEPGRDYAE